MIHETVWLHKSAVLEGKISLAENVSVWCNAALRADGMSITVGKNTNIQDCAVLHGNIDSHVIIGENVSVGHGAVVHGCTIEDACVIGMNAVVLDGAHIGKGSIVGAGAVVPAGMQVPPGSLVVGLPAKIRRSLGPEALEENLENAREYLAFAQAQNFAAKD